VPRLIGAAGDRLGADRAADGGSRRPGDRARPARRPVCRRSRRSPAAAVGAGRVDRETGLVLALAGPRRHSLGLRAALIGKEAPEVTRGTTGAIAGAFLCESQGISRPRTAADTPGATSSVDLGAPIAQNPCCGGGFVVLRGPEGSNEGSNACIGRAGNGPPEVALGSLRRRAGAHAGTGVLHPHCGPPSGSEGDDPRCRAIVPDRRTAGNLVSVSSVRLSRGWA